MNWFTLSDGSLRSTCGRWDILHTPRREDGFRWALIDAERGTVERFVMLTAATVQAVQLTHNKGASR